MKHANTRRSILATVLLLFVLISPSPGTMAGSTPSTSPSHIDLQRKLDSLAQRAQPGTLGIAVLDLQSGQTWRVNAERAYPMMSVFKAPVAAAVLDRIERGQNRFDQTVTLSRADLQSGTIGEHFQGEQMTFTVRELLTDAVSKSDNTAVDALIKLIGGPATVENYLRAHDIEGMRVDHDESGNTRLFEALGPGDTLPPHETDVQQDQRLRRGVQMYLADPGNRSTPEAAALFLQKLWRNELLSPSSSAYLLNLMYAQTQPNRLRAGLPANVRLADICGTSETLDGMTPAYNDIGILTWPDGHTVIVAAFLTASKASEQARHAIYVDLARDVVSALQP